ncbi:hypothetical protein NC653_017756 [Populus alba x Populus x berolinensis]|uniref:Uncharacterized protein n=1 Tax=Populus alba x Populus x berolinensis TaxID=444605 RepID=A0AAD6QRI1_9ROSI|nr:hypothetical protein NC653_017756 [Populus alba x Populus x berolinensis]
MYGLNWQGSIPSACDFHLFKSVSGDGMHLLWHRIIVLLLPIARAHILESWIGQQKIDGVTRQIAVELDTYLNEFDPDGKHMGIGAISKTNPVAARVSTTQEFTLQVKEISQFKLMMIAWKRSSKLLLHMKGIH